MSKLTMIAAAAAAFSLNVSALDDFAQRATQGEALNVVFLGGSLTWGANASDPNRTSYRALIGDKLREQYPQARWRFVDAAIGGTGSGLGIFRVERDVFRHKPDLVFLDFTLNDDLTGTDSDRNSSYEAIVRKIIAEAKCPVVMVILASKGNVASKDIANLKRRDNHLLLAKHYNLQVADVIAGERELFQAGKLNLDEAWPPELFDTTHPHDKGYAVYADIVWQAYLQGVKDKKKPVLPEAWMNPDTYRHIARVKLSDLPRLPEGWRVGYPETRAGTFDFLSSRWLDNVTIAENCVRKGSASFELNGKTPAPLTVKFRGSNVLLFGESTKFSGKFKVSIDGKDSGKEIDAAAFGKMFDPSAYLVCSLATKLDPDQEHSLTITPCLSDKEPQQLHLESVCVAGPNGAYVKQ